MKIGSLTIASAIAVFSLFNIAGLNAAVMAGGYARPELLVTPRWVQAHLKDPVIRIVDMRPGGAYAQGHLPGAVFLPDSPLRRREDRFTYLPTPSTFASMMRKAGIGGQTHVIIYDDQGGKMAARLWYVLNAFGHPNASLVDGGWKEWLASGLPTTKAVPPVKLAVFSPRTVSTLSCPSPAVLRRRPGIVVLDARAPQEYHGQVVSPGATKAGHIPGAVNVEWRENVKGPTLAFKPASELRRLYTARGITPDKQIVVHCASGGRAAQTLFTLKLLGYPNVKIYYGSFSDYSSRAGAPVVK